MRFARQIDIASCLATNLRSHITKSVIDMEDVTPKEEIAAQWRSKIDTVHLSADASSAGRLEEIERKPQKNIYGADSQK